MKPVLPIVAVTAIQEDIVLAAVPMEITIQKNLSFFQKSFDHVLGVPNAREGILHNSFVMPI